MHFTGLEASVSPARRRSPGAVSAANVLLHHSKGWCALKSWAVRLAKRRGLGTAKVALARKLAIVRHKMWMTSEDYRLNAAA